MIKIGEEYERAVWDFVKTLDPNAEVIFDHHVSDRETGKPRQCDVWINAKFENFFPLSFYVSCKDLSRPIDVNKIEHFLGEMYSRRATNGVIFSKSGFTKPALEKAEILGISCCQLFSNAPILISSILLFSHFAYYPSVYLELHGIEKNSGIYKWNDLFNLVLDEKKVIDYIEDVFIEDQEKILDNVKKEGGFPSDWEDNVHIYEPNSPQEIYLKIIGKWRIYTAREEAVLYNGSYCYNGSGSFKGSFTGPPIDTQGIDPGPAWKLISDKNKYNFPNNKIIFYPKVEKIKQRLIETIGNTKINTTKHDLIARNHLNTI